MDRIRQATVRDLDGVMALYAGARAFMRQNGNPSQWPEGYPARESVEQALGDGSLYVLENGGELAAVFTFAIGQEAPYDAIRGHWLTDTVPYGTLHRLAVGRQGGGLGAVCIEYAKARCHDLRIDTHEDNLPMQRLLARLGFVRCGIIDYGDEGTRIAYHWLNTKRAQGECPTPRKEDCV